MQNNPVKEEKKDTHSDSYKEMYKTIKGFTPKGIAKIERDFLTKFSQKAAKNENAYLERDKDGNIPAHLAASLGCTDFSLRIVTQIPNEEENGKEKIDLINARNKENQTPLHIAAENGHTKTVLALITLGASLEAKDDLGDLPLHKAAKQGHTGMILKLLCGEKNQYINEKNNEGFTPLDCAPRPNKESKEGTAAELVQLGSTFTQSLQSNPQSEVTEASSKTNQSSIREKAKTFLNYLGSLRKKTTVPPVQISSSTLENSKFIENMQKTKHLAWLKLLKEFKFKLALEQLELENFDVKIRDQYVIRDKNNNPSTQYTDLPLHYLCRGSYEDLLVNNSDNNNPPSAEEIQTTKQEFLKLLQKLSDDTKLTTEKNGDGKNILHLAAEYGELETIKQITELLGNNKQLLQQVLNAKHQEKEGYTPLDISFIFGHDAIVKFFYEFNTKSSTSNLVVFAMIDNFLRPYSYLRSFGRDKFAKTNNLKEARNNRNQGILTGLDLLYKTTPTVFNQFQIEKIIDEKTKQEQIKTQNNFLHYTINMAESHEDASCIIEWAINHKMFNHFSEINVEKKNLLHLMAHYGESSLLIHLPSLVPKDPHILLAKDKDGNTPLDTACIHGHTEFATRLYQVNPKALSSYIVFNMLNNYLQDFQELPNVERDKYRMEILENNKMQKVANPQAKRNNAIINCFEYLFNTKSSLFKELHKDKNNILHYAINQANTFEEIKPFLHWAFKHGMKPLLEQKNQNNETPFMLAKEKFKVEIEILTEEKSSQSTSTESESTTSTLSMTNR